MLGDKRKPLKGINALTSAIARDFKGGLNTYDPPINLNSRFVTEAVNVYPDPNGALRVRFGTTRFAVLSQFGDTVVAIEYYINALICVMENGVVVAVDATGVPVAIWNTSIAATRPGAPAAWGPTTFVSFAQFGGKLIMCNGVDKPLIVDGSTGTHVVNYLADAGSSSNANVPRAKYCITHNNYLILAVTPTNSTTLYISSKGTSGTFVGDPDPNDAVTFDTSTYLMRGKPEITGLGSFRDRLIVTYDENIMPIQLGTYDSDAHVPKVVDVVENYGAISHRCIVPMGDDIMFLDKVGITSVQRALITATMSPTRESLLVSRDLQRALNYFSPQLLADNVFAVHDRIAQQLMFFVPEATVTPAYMGVQTTKLNELDKTEGLTLSNNETTATVTDTTGVKQVRSVASADSGKFFFQVLVNSANAVQLGIAEGGATVADWSSCNNMAIVYSGSGLAYIDGGLYSYSVGSGFDDKIIDVAVDLDNSKIWFRKSDADGSNPTLWNGTVGQDPATGVGTLNIPSLVRPLYIFAQFGSGGIVDAQSMTFNFGQNSWIGQGPPAGFGPLGGDPILIEPPATIAEDADNTVFVHCVDKSQKFRAMTTFKQMPYRCGARSSDGRVFLCKDALVYYYRNQYEPQYVDFAVAGSQPWDDLTLWDDNTGWQELGTVGTWEGDPIAFSISTPWSDMKEPEKLKEGRYLHCLMEGAGDVTIQQYNDRFTAPQLEMAFNMTEEPETAEHVQRPLNNDQLYAWNSKFTRARLRLFGRTKTALSLLSLGVLYLPGGFRR